ncbi:MaoC family dehydratase [Sphingomonas sp. CGMCC 1.13654]|uniref:MaoC family dehydratase n=1 Tax=Sphingomonas chungangi TaxID=2683589 RepID=A0A838L497_9SPHN|nr:MaoC family dehydratase [Sphingomonas chungangi]MBA2933026.1 MaoC family dehydratase [Sphingomonas chungangi]MVW56646.1 MaoC family dehydratase [Sphingomonas chungangi]
MAGLYFEDFEEGAVYPHEAERTVTLADSIQYACMCMDTEPRYLSEAWAAKNSPHGRVQIHPLYVLSLIMGVQVTELTLGTTLGNLSMGGVSFPHPVFPGDTLRGVTTILGKRASSTKPDRGIVDFLHDGLNQRDEIVARCTRRGMMVTRAYKSVKA